jgi:hypothetical protein
MEKAMVKSTIPGLDLDAMPLVGKLARESARRAGTPIHYMDPDYGDDIIREYPDGRRERMIKGQDGVVVAIPPRAER